MLNILLSLPSILKFAAASKNEGHKPQITTIGAFSASLDINN
uniref:Uncharacterized protein n=1 Tax=Romanomermis culicivorax TaxID=13658 RepID=A0A915K9L4_ROMCU